MPYLCLAVDFSVKIIVFYDTSQHPCIPSNLCFVEGKSLMGGFDVNQTKNTTSVHFKSNHNVY